MIELFSTYLCSYHRTEEFIIASANCVALQGAQITYGPYMFLLTIKALGFSLPVKQWGIVFHPPL